MTDHEIPSIVEQIVNPIEVETWINRTLSEDNMLDVLHFSTLFGLINSIQSPLRTYIHSHLDETNAFLYILKVTDLKSRTSHDFSEEIEYCYWIVRYLILAKLNSNYAEFDPLKGEVDFKQFWMLNNELYY